MSLGALSVTTRAPSSMMSWSLRSHVHLTGPRQQASVVVLKGKEYLIHVNNNSDLIVRFGPSPFTPNRFTSAK